VIYTQGRSNRMSEGQRFEGKSGDSAERTDQPDVRETVIGHITKFEDDWTPAKWSTLREGTELCPCRRQRSPRGQRCCPKAVDSANVDSAHRLWHRIRVLGASYTISERSTLTGGGGSRRRLMLLVTTLSQPFVELKAQKQIHWVLILSLID
jgi:hypothetical protein